MSEQKHTQGPLRRGRLEPWKIHDGREEIAAFRGQNAENDAFHAVKCWNACEGINPEAVPDLLRTCELASAMIKQMSGATTQDKINLRAIKSLLHKAIAKAKGE